MKPFHLLAALAVGLAATAAGRAQIESASFNFDSQISGSLASVFHTSAISFHNAHLVPSVDEFGDAIPGTDHWEIDAASDALFPLLVVNPDSFYGRGLAPSPTNALDAVFQPVLLSFSSEVTLFSFSTILDNDTFGNLGAVEILFLNGNAIVGSFGIDQTIAGLAVSLENLGNVTGVVLPSNALYDNINVRFQAVPEPGTWGLMGAGLLGVLVVNSRRQRRRS